METIDKKICFVRKKMHEKGVERLLVTSPSNLTYITGMADVSGFLFITKESWEILVSKFYRYAFKNVSRAVVFSERKEMIEEVEKRLEEGFVCDRELGLDNLEDTTDILEDIRKVKRGFEIERIKESCRINDEVFSELLKKFKTGMTEWDLVKEIDSGFRKRNCYNSFDTLVHSNNLIPHREPEEREIGIEDIVIVDMGCRFRNYCSDMTRVIPNELKGKRRKLLEDVLEIQEFALSLIRPGLEVSKLCEAVLDKVDDMGYSTENDFLHSLGHGIGVDIHEKPNISRDSDHVLEKGNVFTVEPGLYVENIGGARIEDIILVDSEGYKVLSKSKKRF